MTGGGYIPALRYARLTRLYDPVVALTLSEVWRVLKPGGALLVCDGGPDASPYARLAFTAVGLLDGFEVSRDSVEGRLPHLMTQAGFVGVDPATEMATAVGTLQFIGASKPGTGTAGGMTRAWKRLLVERNKTG